MDSAEAKPAKATAAHAGAKIRGGMKPLHADANAESMGGFCALTMRFGVCMHSRLAMMMTCTAVT